MTMALFPQSDELGSLSPEQVDTIQALLPTLMPGQRLLLARWLLGGFDAGALASDQLALAHEPKEEARAGLTVLYGSHSGHSAGIARQVAEQAIARGWSARLCDMADYARGSLRRERNLLIVVSTHGEGDPPESAAPFFEFLLGERAPRLTDCVYAVLALGDRSYTKFCKAGADLDGRFDGLGAKRLLPRLDLDVDYTEGANAWTEQALTAFSSRMTAKSRVETNVRSIARPVTRISRENPFLAELAERIELSGRGSTQRFVHLELSLEGSNIQYQPGDALGVRPENDPALVDELMRALGQAPEYEVSVAGNEIPLVEALRHRLEIRRIVPSALRRYAAFGAKGLESIVANTASAEGYVGSRDWLDVLTEHPIGIRAEDFVALLPELASRSYSIASCQVEHPDEVHLLVSRVEYTAHGRPRQGVASSHLASRLKVGDRLGVWLEPNKQFRLPENPDQPIILIGAGTGIAPYRAFLEACAGRERRGKIWVFFGNRNFDSDFTYQTEWLHWRKQGVLTRMDVAFSRDQAQKIYVSDRIRESHQDLFEWLEQGAKVYVCGDRSKLAVDVDRALTDVVMRAGDKSLEQATQYLERLRTEQRYLKDVY